MPINYKACPIYNKDKKHYKDCPVPIPSMCHFSHCDLWSDKMCGDCIHFEGTLGTSGKRTTVGHCLFIVGTTTATQKCNCPHYYKKPEGFVQTYSEWVEERVALEIDDPHCPQARPIRKKYLEEWKKIFDKK